MSLFHGIKWIDTSDTVNGFKNIDGKPRFSSMPYLYDIAETNIPDHLFFAKYGRCTCSNSSIDVWEANSAYVFPVSAVKMDVTSTDNTNDNIGGTGALKIIISGLSADYSEITEEVIMTGTTIATTTSNFLRINSVWVSSAGSGGAAAGTINIKGTGGSTVYAIISPGLTQTRQLIYTVPLGKILYITSISFSSGVGNTTSSGKANYVTFTTRAKVKPDDGASNSIFYPYNEIGIENSSFHRELEIPTRIPETADLKVSVVGDTNLSVGCVAAIRGWQEV